jgi:carbamoylphosphate synthase large subunit
MKQKVVVIGHGYTSRLGVIRALGTAGYEVIVIVMMVNKRKGKPDTSRPIDSYSKYISQIHYCLPDSEKLINLLLEKCVDSNQKVVIIPDSDMSAAAVDLNQDRLEKHFLFPHINHCQGSVVEWMNKIRQKETALKLSLNVAQGVVVEVVDGTYTLPSTITYPCFPKPLATLVGAKTGLGKCETEQDLHKAINLLIQRYSTISILVEEYKKIDVEHALMGISDGHNVLIPGIIHTTSLALGGHFGVAKRGLIEPCDGYEELLDGFKAFVRETSFVGIFDIDFFKSEGKYYFCEMNFRYGGSGYAYTKMGANLPVMFVQMMTGEASINDKSVITKRAVFVNERMCLEDWYKGYISTKDFKSLIRNRDISFVDDLEDSEPERMFKKMVRREGRKRIVKKIIGK